MFENKYCTITKNEKGYVIHSKRGTYPDKQVETLRGASIATQIPLYELERAFANPFLKFASGYMKNIPNGAK